MRSRASPTRPSSSSACSSCRPALGVLLCGALIAGRALGAALAATTAVHPADLVDTVSPTAFVNANNSEAPPARGSPTPSTVVEGRAVAASGKPKVTRISPVPPDAPKWAGQRRSSLAGDDSISRSDVAGSNLVLVDAMPSGSREPTATATSTRQREAHKCRPETTFGASRRLRNRSDPLPYRDGPLRDIGDIGDAMAPDAVFDVFEIDGRRVQHVRDRDGEPPYELWDGAERRPQYFDDDFELPPSYQDASGSGESVEAYPASKHHDDGLKEHGADGRGPVVVRAPPINAVAIGFLIYLVLLTLLQGSIYETSQKGLLSSLLGPLGLKPSRNRRYMEDDEILGLGQAGAGERRVSILGLEHHDQHRTTSTLEPRPVLVAAVLDSESDSTAMGGPRRARKHFPRSKKLETHILH